MLKLPQKLPRLDTPHFILATPEWLQLMVMLLMFLTLPGLLLAWVAIEILAARADGFHYAVAVTMLIMLAGAAHPRTWHRWVIFACDRHGIYLGTFRGEFPHVPWSQVGPSEVGIAGLGSYRQRTVILPLRVDDTTWSALAGQRPRMLEVAADAAGYRPYGIGNAWRDVTKTQQDIEAIRLLARSAS